MLLAVLAISLSGCERTLDSPEYGEIIFEVPPELNRPYPLPELDEPPPSPLPGPGKTEEATAEPNK